MVGCNQFAPPPQKKRSGKGMVAPGIAATKASLLKLIYVFYIYEKQKG